MKFLITSALNVVIYKEVSKKYINKINDEMITICYDCSKKRYIESLMVVSSIENIGDFES